MDNPGLMTSLCRQGMLGHHTKTPGFNTVSSFYANPGLALASIVLMLFTFPSELPIWSEPADGDLVSAGELGHRPEGLPTSVPSYLETSDRSYMHHQWWKIEVQKAKKTQYFVPITWIC